MPISRNNQLIQILLRPDGFQVTHGPKVIWKVRFDDIERIEGYQRDEIDSDLICLDIQTSDGHSPMGWIHEDIPGFNVLVERLRRLPGFDADWRAKVALQPFAETRTVVYDRG
jgi:hypothetical protein